MNQITNDINTINQLAEIIKVNKATMAIKMEGLTADAYKALLDANFILFKTIIDKKTDLHTTSMTEWAEVELSKSKEMDIIDELVESLI